MGDFTIEVKAVKLRGSAAEYLIVVKNVEESKLLKAQDVCCLVAAIMEEISTLILRMKIM